MVYSKWLMVTGQQWTLDDLASGGAAHHRAPPPTRSGVSEIWPYKHQDQMGVCLFCRWGNTLK
jgi:hypothetical protein